MSFFEGEHLRTIVGGRWIRRPGSGAATSGVGIDTRADLAGRAFVAIRGERHDGHDHLGAAHRAGATLALVERVPPEPSREDEIPGGLGVILVPDTRQALGRMALAYRRTLGGTRVIAITGSSGKTTTKRLVDAVLGAGFDGTAAPRSFNNDIGVPLTILAARPRDRYLVVEIGANGPGEIARLARITEPDIAVITTVGRAHLEGFGTVEAVAREKASLLANLRPGGVAFVNADARELDRYRRAAATMVRFGERADADLRLTARGGDPEQGWWFEVNGVARYRLALPGRHLAVDALAAVGIGLRFGLAEERISGALGAVEPEPMRMARRDVGGIRLFNDAYNANPDSMDAALEAFVEASAGASRRVVILGDMLELGPDSPALHRELGRRILQIGGGSGIDRAVMIGPQAALAAEVVAGTWPASRISAMDALDETALRTIASDLRAGDAVLLKASRGIGMERVAEALALQEAHDAVTDDALQPPATLG